MGETMKVTGQCHCGAIAFEAELDADNVRICHCTDCQKLSGSAFRVNVGCKESSFHLLRGTPRIYIKVADSGNRRQQGFCETCGAQIFSAAEHRTPGGMISLRVGTLDQRAQLVPHSQIFVRSAMPWLPSLPGTAYPGDGG